MHMVVHGILYGVLSSIFIVPSLCGCHSYKGV